jgi:acetolactate synthase small subunit
MRTINPNNPFGDSHQHHVLSVLVQNRPGVLARVSGLFARRGYNIYSLAVAPTDDADYSRITIVVDISATPLEQIVKLEREMSQVQEKYKHAEENYGSELLNLVVAKGYLGKLLANDAVRSYVARHSTEILEQFELVLSTVSMEEAVEQADRQEPMRP